MGSEEVGWTIRWTTRWTIRWTTHWIIRLTSQWAVKLWPSPREAERPQVKAARGRVFKNV